MGRHTNYFFERNTITGLYYCICEHLFKASLKDETTAAGAIEGTKSTEGFGDAHAEICITRYDAVANVSHDDIPLWGVPFTKEENTEIGFASSDDAFWSVRKFYGTQGNQNLFLMNTVVLRSKYF